MRFKDGKHNRLIFVNGPPRSGKDTFFDVASEFGGVLYKMTEPSDLALKAFLRLTDEEYKVWREERKSDLYIKGNIIGVAFRQLLINISEEFAKPSLGNSVFGELAVPRVLELLGQDSVVITDCGFQDEVRPIIREVHAQSPETEIHAVKVFREGCEWDSREEVNFKEFGITAYSLHNIDLDHYKAMVRAYFTEVLGVQAQHPNYSFTGIKK